MLERTHRIVLLSIAAAGLILGSIGSLAAAPAYAASTFTVFVAPASKGGSDNVLGTVFGTGASQAAWTLDPPGQTYAGNSGCAIPSGLVRISGSGNS